MANGDSSCPFCGRPLRVRDYALPGRRPMPVTLPCDCPQATELAESEEREAERERRAADFAERWGRAGIPEAFSHVDADFSHVGALEGGRSLYLHGPNGRGKTHLACRIAKGWLIRNLRRRPSALFLAARDMASLVGSARDRWDQTEEDVFARWCGVGLLVLDDVGKGTASEYGADLLFRVVDGRWANGRPMVITSQYGTRELAERYGRAAPETNGALLSRIRGWCDGIALTGPDRRLEHAR